MKHTKGPWKVQKRIAAYRFFAEHNHLIPIKQNEAGYVAYVSANNFSPDSNANARLIAAAPEMLEALKTAVYIIGDTVTDDLIAIGLDSWLFEARAAIAKADGSQTDEELADLKEHLTSGSPRT